MTKKTTLTEYESACIRYWALEYSLRSKGCGNQTPQAVRPADALSTAKIFEQYILGNNPDNVLKIVLPKPESVISQPGKNPEQETK